MKTDIKVHETASVDPGAKIGNGTVIWQHCILMDGAHVGEHCKLAHNVFVEGGVTVGDGVTIKDNVTLYSGLTVKDSVFIGPNAVFTNVKTPRAFLSRKDGFLPTVIGHGATIGANATIVCGITIGAYALVGAGSVVTRDVPDYALVAGNPALQKGWVSKNGCVLDSSLICPETSERYAEDGASLVCLG